MRVTIIYDNTSYRDPIKADWGFAALVELENTPKILFDTGADGKVLLANMQKLAIDPSAIEEVFISHAHYDHTGGIDEFLRVNRKAKFFVPPSFSGPSNRNVFPLARPTWLHNAVFSTGELEGIEQAMGIKTNKGFFLITGCSHPYMGNILEAARRFGNLYGIIGGMHSFNEFGLFDNLGLICPAHCTQHQKEIRSLYPNQYIGAGAGRIIQIP